MYMFFPFVELRVKGRIERVGGREMGERDSLPQPITAHHCPPRCAAGRIGGQGGQGEQGGQGQVLPYFIISRLVSESGQLS